jgi:hypothetical protein
LKVFSIIELVSGKPRRLYEVKDFAQAVLQLLLKEVELPVSLHI